MPELDVFLEVFRDVRFPLLAVDLDILDSSLKQTRPGPHHSRFAVRIDVPNEKRAAFTSSIRGLIRQIDVPAELVEVFCESRPLKSSASADRLRAAAAQPGQFAMAEVQDELVWEEDSLWPLAYSTFLSQLLNVCLLNRIAIEQRRSHTNDLNIDTLSEFPRQYPTHVHYAMASLGAWLGGAINVQYFSYYATIRQIHHSDLNVKYGKRVGFTDDAAGLLDKSGIIVLPASLLLPLFEAQGNSHILGSIAIDEANAANLPDKSFWESRRREDSRALPGFVIDKYYRAPFFARQSGRYGFYGCKNVLRDHYTDFYRSVDPASFVRCKHYCAPVIEISSMDELREHVSNIPIHHETGLLFRGQRQLYLLEREAGIQRMLFADSCSAEPSLVTSAARVTEYDYDVMHFLLKFFLEQKVIESDSDAGDAIRDWRNLSQSADCALDNAILALAQHYGLPSHGLDVTTSEDVAIWFATNLFVKDQAGLASYRTIDPGEWDEDAAKHPVVLVCQAVTHSTQQSIHDCHELAKFGFEAKRPAAQRAKFFQGGHSDHQNRLAEALVCVFRLTPAHYQTVATFETLFPAPRDDPAYRLMLEFATHDRYRTKWGSFVNRFH